MRGVVTLGTLVALALTVGAVEKTRREREGAARAAEAPAPAWWGVRSS